MFEVGDNFAKGVTRIGRQRLSPGLVAILDDAETLSAAIGELHAYATQDVKAEKARRGIVFRLVSEGERKAFNFKLQELLGVETFADNAATFRVVDGQDWGIARVAKTGAALW